MARILSQETRQMRDFAIVKGIEGQRIEVVSLISDACITCSSIDCAKQGKSFHVINKRNVPISENNIVRIGFPRILNGILGLISLFTPIFCSAIGFFFSPIVATKLGFELTQTTKALTVIAFFFISSALVFIISRTDLHLTHPEIIQVL